MPITLYKIGGSLLDLSDLTERLTRLWAQRPHTTPLLVVGGGPTADLVRRWDAVHRLGDETAHWLAIRSLGLNESLLRELLPNCRSVMNREELLAVSEAGNIPLLAAEAFLREDEESTGALPHNWSVTSDSIAARVAIRFQVEELALVKSVACPVGQPVAEEHNRELIDGHFEQLAEKIPLISWCDLRAAELKIENWLRAGRPFVSESSAEKIGH